jgi:hypothetical protein
MRLSWQEITFGVRWNSGVRAFSTAVLAGQNPLCLDRHAKWWHAPRSMKIRRIPYRTLSTESGQIQYLPDLLFLTGSLKSPAMWAESKQIQHGRKGTTMNLTNYLWYESYLNAICETDETRKAGRILEARSALEERLLSPVQPGSDEEGAIQTAQRELRMLTPERILHMNGRSDDLLQGAPG